MEELIIVIRAPEADHPADACPPISTPNPLQETADASGHLGQRDRVDVANIDADLQGRCSNADTIPIGSHLLFNALALHGRQRPEMKMYRPSRAGELLVEIRRHRVCAVARTQAAELDLAADHPKFAPRMDIVALVPNGSTGWGLGFFEAKLLSNGALRASGERRPKILDQLRVYEVYLSDPNRRNKVAAAYRTTCRELTDLWDLAAESDKRAPVLSQPVRDIAEGGDLQVDPQPRLVLFHRCQGVGKFNEAAWTVHREKLVTEGVDIIERSRADDIRLGR